MYFKPISNIFAKSCFLNIISPLIFKNHPAITHKIREFKGNKIFDAEKSSISNIVLSKSFKLFKIPKDNVAGMLIADTMKNIKMLAFTRDNLNLSTKVAHGTSNMLIPEVIAAQNNKIKNAPAITLPQGICINTFGKVTNTNPAPELASSPKENTAGKIIMPARTENSMLEKIIVYAECTIHLSSFI